MKKQVLTLVALVIALACSMAAQAKKMTHHEAIANVASRVNPVYPAPAKQMRIEGTVEVDVEISDDGKVVKAEAATGNPLLIKAAVEAVKQWKFKSGPALATISFSFKL